MPQQKFSSGKYALGICDICGWRYPWTQLKLEPISAYGSPSNQSSGLYACPTCWDPPHPQSFLPIEVQRHGSDPQQLRFTRPDIFPIAYPISYRLAGALYTNSSLPLQAPHGATLTINGLGTYSGYSVSIGSVPAGITVLSGPTLTSPSNVSLQIHVNSLAVPGIYLMSIMDALQTPLNGQIQIT